MIKFLKAICSRCGHVKYYNAMDWNQLQTPMCCGKPMIYQGDANVSKKKD